MHNIRLVSRIKEIFGFDFFVSIHVFFHSISALLTAPLLPAISSCRFLLKLGLGVCALEMRSGELGFVDSLTNSTRRRVPHCRVVAQCSWTDQSVERLCAGILVQCTCFSWQHRLTHYSPARTLIKIRESWCRSKQKGGSAMYDCPTALLLFPQPSLRALLQVQGAIDRYPARIGRINGIIEFNIAGSSSWVIDLKQNPGKVYKVRF